MCAALCLHTVTSQGFVALCLSRAGNTFMAIALAICPFLPIVKRAYPMIASCPELAGIHHLSLRGTAGCALTCGVPHLQNACDLHECP